MSPPVTPHSVTAPYAGIACILAGVFLMTISDALAKHLGQWYAPVQILFMRTALALPVVLAVALALGGRRVLRSAYLPLHLARGALNIVSAVCFYMGLRHLPLAENAAIAFSAPLFVTALSVWLFKERVDGLRWLAVWLGFGGVLIVACPEAGSLQLAALYPLAAAMLYAIMMLSARAIGSGEGMLTTAFYIVSGQLLFSALTVPWFWRAIAWPHMPFFVAIALVSTVGLTLITQAFRLAAASVVAPFDYSALAWSALVGWLFWGEIPPALAWLGMALIVGSGLYVGWQAHRQHQWQQRSP